VRYIRNSYFAEAKADGVVAVEIGVMLMCISRKININLAGNMCINYSFVWNRRHWRNDVLSLF